MAGRGRTSYQKRQKEQVRLERRQAKAARKEERKANKDPNESDIQMLDPDELGELDVELDLPDSNDPPA